MNLCVGKDFDRARVLLECAASVYNLETTNLYEKYLFNKSKCGVKITIKF